MRYVIIGNSAAGVRAAETLRLLDPSASILMIAEDREPAYSRCLLPNYLEGTRSLYELRIRPKDFYQKNRLETLFGTRVVAVHPSSKEVELEDGGRIQYDKLLIATGGSSFIPPLPGLNSPNVFGLRDIADAKGILEACQTATNVVVIGAGFVGLEAAYALKERGLNVTVVERLPQILPQQMDEKAAGILEKDMAGMGIEILTGVGITEVRSPGWLGQLFGKKDKRVLLEDGRQLKAEVIIVATGSRANVDLVKNTDMKINRGIPVNQFMETSIEDIYAAGDVAETYDVVTRQQGLSPIWPSAMVQGRVAAYNMAGQKKAYGGLIAMQNAVEFRKIPAIAIGITQPKGDEYEILEDYRPSFNKYKKLVLKNGILVGMILVGNIEQAGVIGALIKQHADVSAIKEKILSNQFNYSTVLYK